ncbi:NAD(P)-dependent alcohol dehydrogenase [Mesorhizobium sp. M2D.F.Ca.ET.185.01.1.1]|uniref:zinc-dependent alcohol dehydrogenase family protein n=2 Tax=Mesorhizobium TaxID=68287 RepID=UPI000FCB8C6F|nr:MULTISPECIES: NAD(P)-dependent alcohol dehydrogenase [unclassified Mesorhizobium]TGP78900.1 NAD(P)-dependent alcohol dehydrogenase [bacterium M00.F.Ca.ET.227.01.1.1]TGP89572.1 NAD(P)-dependent alcohol dehydrogenase [bacterium M00.F.Ca.ET.221.01.1.1]TGP94940.1 NAD(P)-dependent alcohol dehydrogenase [bacterium M00.F.Ca.ET.222.01.1.1]TGT71120.1 NAD(P)-dependent alcohol dehydrogenase [bacterium M00.F.Ca.ET.159.01.1.1]TGT82963.1 NAD(P)-dependent alcohol dehydrogenase [bacterium M00.F.Ca.ET.157.0
MLSYRFEKFGDIEKLVVREAAMPQPTANQILVRVRATSLNRRDTMILNGTYPLAPRAGVVPLSDGAGEVVAVGDRVTRFAIGDRVTGSYFARWIDGRMHPGIVDQLGCTLDGMLSEYALLDEQWAVRLPEHLSWQEAATFTCAGLTAWSALTGAEIPKPGQWVLVIGSGGVALFALQFAKLMGCRVAAVTSRAKKAERLRALGADLVVAADETREWGMELRAATGSIDLVVETGGPVTFAQSLIASALYGRIVLLTVQDKNGKSVEIPGAIYQRSLVTIGRLFVGSRSGLEAMLAAVATHRLKPVIDKVFPFAEAREAYRYFDRGDVFGKVVIDGA